MKNLDNVEVWSPPTGRKGHLRLDLNENIYAPPKKVFEEIADFDRFNVNGYPEYDELKSLISHYVGSGREEIFLSTGADQSISVMLRALFEEGDKVVLPTPSFSVYPHFCKVESLEYETVPFSMEGEEPKFPLENTLEEIQGAEGVIVINPNNPLGTSIGEEEIRELVEKAREEDAFIVFDEAYFEFCGTTAKERVEDYDKSVILRTFSKFFGLAGLRLGYMIANKSLVRHFKKFVGPWNVNHMAVFAGEKCLNNVSEFEALRDDIIDARADLCEFFLDKGFETWDTDTNFLLVRGEEIPDLIYQLEKRGIRVSDMSGYPHDEGFLDNSMRLSVPIGEDLKHFKNVVEGVVG